MILRSARRGEARRGTAVAELAIVLPLLGFFMVIGIDFARVFCHSLTIANAARNGAIYGSQSMTASGDYNGIKAAALADCAGMSPTPQVLDQEIVSDTYGNQYVKVTVTYAFSTITDYPFVPSALTIQQSCQIRIQPAIGLPPVSGP
jgi:Flp pilus assembly protein TadG